MSTSRANALTVVWTVVVLAAFGAFIWLLFVISQPRTDKGYVYTSVPQCVAGKVFTPAYCQQTHDQAQQLAARNAPRYKKLSDCQHDWGKSQCTVTTSAPPRYIPVFSAWFLYANSVHKSPVPLYTDDSEGHASLSTDNGDHISGTPGRGVTVDDSVVSDGASAADAGSVHTANVQDHPVVDEDHPAPPVEDHQVVEDHPVEVR